MNIRLACSLVALFSSPLLAQGHFTTPPVGTDKEGTAHTTVFGWSNDYRHLVMDDTHTGKGAYTLTRVALRADYQDQKSAGRTWSRTTLEIHDVQYQPVKLVSKTPALVFDAKWSWPTLSGKPLLKPDNWGGVKGQLSYNFSKPFVYSGKNALLLDFKFRGGTLHSNKRWIGFNHETIYNLDSHATSTINYAAINYVPKNPARCHDSGDPYYPHGTNAAIATHTAQKPPAVSVAYSTFFTARKSPLIYTVGLAGSTEGIAVGARCNRLHVDLTRPHVMVLVPAPDNALGRATYSFGAAWNPALSQLWLQAAWADTKTSQLALTYATRADVVNPAHQPRAKATYNIIADSTQWPIEKRPFWTTLPQYLPMLRYDHK